MNKALIYGLLLSTLMVTAPHAVHLPLWVSALCFSVLVWRSYLTYSGNTLPKRGLLTAITLGSMGGILIEFHTLFGREVGVALLMLLATLKLMELRTMRDAMALLFLSCFIIITNFFYSQSLPTGLYMLATLLVIATIWVHLNAPEITFKPRLRVAATLLLQAIPLTLILFVLFPRVQGPLWGMPQDAYSSSGLDDKMTPGSLGKLALSDEVAFRVSYPGRPPRRDQMYWRGPVLWLYDGSTWTPGRNRQGIQPNFTDATDPIEYNVTLEPHNKNWLFLLDMPNHISITAGLSDDFQVLSREPVNARLRYEARSHLRYTANMQESAGQLQRALQLPQGFNPRARELAAGWRSKADNETGIVQEALAYFHQQEFFYTLEPPLLGRDSVDDFLFNTRRGFCEHYASAFVFLMRAAGIPARVVTGYQGGELNAVGNYYIVRQSDAHAWAEVWLAGHGWQRIDPTAAVAPARVERSLSAALPDNAALPFMSRNPPQWMRELRLNWDALSNRWNQWVLGYDSELQFALLSRLGMESVSMQKMALNMIAGLGIIIALFAAFMLRHLFKREQDKVQTAWLKVCRKLAKAGMPRAAHEGPQDYAKRVAIARPDLKDAIHDLANRYSALRYRGMANHEQEFLYRATTFSPSKRAS